MNNNIKTNAISAASSSKQVRTDNYTAKLHQKTSFTPGPWTYEEDRLVYGDKFIADCEFGGLHPGDPSINEQIANAHLIAAAPELYKALVDGAEALKDIINAAENGGQYRTDEMDGIFGGVLSQMQDAIAKARGEGENHE
jgi:hypothetical protein